jgi:hypothetical protein
MFYLRITSITLSILLLLDDLKTIVAIADFILKNRYVRNVGTTYV